ncbi:MAG: hypothetical protein PHO26_00805 [Dehalococcoidia bacterium]|nr:hypothetical protein [Dehalococcoidia bacterium]MDD5493787.1 hypothetical protein [Dehalococcoidia bacterium]
MEKQEDTEKKSAAENFSDMFDAFGNAMSRIFNDPDLKEKVKELGNAAKESADTLGERFKDEEVRQKFREAGQAAQAFGKNITDFFSEEKKNDTNGKK